MGDFSGILYLFDLVDFTIERPLLTGVWLLLNGEDGSTGTLVPDLPAVCPFGGVFFPFLTPSLTPSIPSTATTNSAATTPRASGSPPKSGMTRICSANAPIATSRSASTPLLWTARAGESDYGE